MDEVGELKLGGVTGSKALLRFGQELVEFEMMGETDVDDAFKQFPKAREQRDGAVLFGCVGSWDFGESSDKGVLPLVRKVTVVEAVVVEIDE